MEALQSGRMERAVSQLNILVDIGHPGHVHFYKYPMRIWAENGHNVIVVCRDIQIVSSLLRSIGLKAAVVSRKRKGAVGLLVELVEHAARTISVIRKEKVDICTAVGGTFTVIPSALTRRACVVFNDTEAAVVENAITTQFASVVATPSSFAVDIGPKQLLYRGQHELCYLSDDVFTPDSAVPARYGYNPEDGYCIVRFISWDAGHDIGLRGLSAEEKVQIVEHLAGQGPVLVVPEGDVPSSIQRYCAKILPEDFHDILAFARRCVTEGATTASEACVLGVPSVYVNPLVAGTLTHLASLGLLEIVSGREEVYSALKALDVRFPSMEQAYVRAERYRRSCVHVAQFVAELVERFGGAS